MQTETITTKGAFATAIWEAEGRLCEECSVEQVQDQTKNENGTISNTEVGMRADIRAFAMFGTDRRLLSQGEIDD